ncbi:MAG: site-2 protease family protein [Anaerolineales bacterium]|nr:site-2 protease family protein [Anaerolineales bacterium]
MFGLSPSELIARAIVLVVAFTVHEFAHAFAADRLGDDTPRSQGRLTLNPLAHLDPIGSLLLLIAGIGWAKPVMVNPAALERRHPAAPMLVALAGPLSNFLLALLAAIPFQMNWVVMDLRAGALLPTAFQLLDAFVYINLLLMLFNLIPVFPLDGEKIFTFFLPPSGKAFMERIRPYGSLILLAAIFLLPRLGIDVLGYLVWQPMIQLYRVLMGG